MESENNLKNESSNSVLQQTTQDVASDAIVGTEEDPAILNIEALKPIYPGSPSDKVLCLSCGKVHSHYDECN